MVTYNRIRHTITKKYKISLFWGIGSKLVIGSDRKIMSTKASMEKNCKIYKHILGFPSHIIAQTFEIVYY